MLSANQHRRDLTPTQRAVVALELMPRIAEDVNRERIEKLQQTLARKAGRECLANSPNTQAEPESPISSRVIAANMMGVGDNYVGLAKRVKEASLELFEEVRAGEVTLSEACRGRIAPSPGLCGGISLAVVATGKLGRLGRCGTMERTSTGPSATAARRCGPSSRTYFGLRQADIGPAQGIAPRRPGYGGNHGSCPVGAAHRADASAVSVRTMRRPFRARFPG